MVSDGERRFLAQQRIAHLATADRRAVPHVVPVCFAIFERTLYITIDEKPKRRPPAALKRLRNIAENPAVAVIVDRYDEDWARLGWVMLRGHAEILRAARRHADCKIPRHRRSHRTNDKLGQLVGGRGKLTMHPLPLIPASAFAGVNSSGNPEPGSPLSRGRTDIGANSAPLRHHMERGRMLYVGMRLGSHRPPAAARA